MPGHDHLRQGRDLRHRADGRRDRAQGHLRRLHERARSTSIELFHGYTYSAPSARLRGRRSRRSTSIATRSCSSAPRRSKPIWADAIDGAEGPARTCSTSAPSASSAAIDLASRPDAVGERAYEAMDRAFHDHGLMIRITGDTIALSPPLIVTEDADRRDLRQGGEGDAGGGVRVTSSRSESPGRASSAGEDYGTTEEGRKPHPVSPQTDLSSGRGITPAPPPSLRNDGAVARTSST